MITDNCWKRTQRYYCIVAVVTVSQRRWRPGDLGTSRAVLTYQSHHSHVLPTSLAPFCPPHFFGRALYPNFVSATVYHAISTHSVAQLAHTPIPFHHLIFLRSPCSDGFVYLPRELMYSTCHSYCLVWLISLWSALRSHPCDFGLRTRFICSLPAGTMLYVLWQSVIHLSQVWTVRNKK